MSTITIFSVELTSREKIDHVYPILLSWSEFQITNDWKKYGYYISYIPERKIYTFNFFVINQDGLSEDQKEKVWAIFESQNMGILRVTTKPLPAK